VDLDELSPVGGRAAGRRDSRSRRCTQGEAILAFARLRTSGSTWAGSCRQSFGHWPRLGCNAISRISPPHPGHNATLNAFLAVDREGALARAADIDARRKAGRPLGPLAGLPVGVKDALCTSDLPTTCASKMHAGYRPPYDAEVVARLRRTDAVIVGKTNMDEFAMGGSNENSAFGPVRNPWDTTRTPGG
jgi:hypothetical protein